MQLAKTVAAIDELHEARLPLFCLLTDPTFGGGVRVLQADADLHALRRRGGTEPGGVGERQPVHGEPDARGSSGAGGGRGGEQDEQSAHQ